MATLANAARGSAIAASDPPPAIIPLTANAQTAPEFVPGRLLVKFAPEASSSDILTAYGLQSMGSIGALGVQIVEVEPGQEQNIAADLTARPDVIYAEPDYIRHASTSPLVTPNDTYYAGYQWQLPHIRAEQAWDVTTGSDSIIIAVADSGVDLTHPDLAAKIVAGYDFINNDNDPSDDNGHGTHVASIAAATTNNNNGIAGVSWGAKIMPIKVLDANASGTDSQVANGIVWAVNNGADIINLSLGGPSASSTLESAVNYAYNQGALLVAAAGNDYQGANQPSYPAAYPNVMAVAATNDADGHASYSNSGSYVDIAAPGGDPTGVDDTNPRHWIIGAYWRGSPLNSEVAWMAGTSQAAPHVAGVAALLLSIDNTLAPDELRGLITSTAVDVQLPGWDEFSGYGRVDAAAAVNAAVVQLTPTATPSPTPTVTPTPSVTPTPTVTPTATATPILACSERIDNGGFEVNAAWSMPNTASGAVYTTAESHSGARSARLGLLPAASTSFSLPTSPFLPPQEMYERNLLGEVAPAGATYSTVYQTFTIPADATQVTLNFWYQPHTLAQA
ncbi:MAG: peptidase S8, partial [Chloroflexi bacterium]|nr:peptidase S8 [Chloroflexota bacterium]